MREVSASAATKIYRPREPLKPTEVGDAVNRHNPDKTQVNTGGISIQGCPRRGDRCGDTLTRGILAFIKDRFFGKIGSQVVH
jgi:hypothetical protein